MKVTLIDYTGAGTPDPASYAANVLIFTKQTRLEMSPRLMQEIADWPYSEKMAQLEYMANTIPSSWEFVHYTFMIEGVTRGFTHQLVRTRQASYAQQTMRVLNVKGWEYGTGPTVQDHAVRKQWYDDAMKYIARVYDKLVEGGAAIEDARGVLPTNILTNIVMSCNMRTFVELTHKRTSPRVQGEYREFITRSQDAVRTYHPWIDLFVDRTFDRAAKDLDKEIEEIEDKEKRTRMIKLVDQLRAKQ